MSRDISKELPMVEIFQTVEGEGLRAGFPTTFIRLFHCNLRCTWCDTTYSYAPAKPVFTATIAEIVNKVKKLPNPSICLTGGEPLIHGEHSLHLIQELVLLPFIKDIHIETNGAIDLKPYHQWRLSDKNGQKVRFILDYKLPASGEQHRMIEDNFSQLTDTDEVKFVIQDEHDFQVARKILQQKVIRGTPLFSPVWEICDPKQLVTWIQENHLRNVKLNLQLHKYIWDPEARGV
ncbi:7-carboxy-7-deazaguanine synthase [Seinonella peptonophila]|uniref:7-carboxy-7-deazaguanine synthase n=1 Tax=Seinonella peptonophila TaxID=112248 RepID=A0A1M4XIP8_9BACL|nr:radical SAM protein [Seinonella peptonophila]SHE93537.1 7-carboxy-7-deazaguanine synthase [Seinonella peptonophila]